MTFAILLFTVVSILHSFAFGEASVHNADDPIFISSGISWDSSRNQFFLSRTSGSSIFVVESGISHAAHAKFSIKKFLGMRAVRRFKAQAVHLGTSMLWRIEVKSSSFNHGIDSYLVGYDLKKLTVSRTLKKDISYKLPSKKDYTALTVSPDGIVFAIDTFGGILKIHPTRTTTLASSNVVQVLLPSQQKSHDSSPLDIVYDDKGKFLIVVKLQFHILTLTVIDPDNGKSTILQLDTKLPLFSTNSAICSPSRLLSLHSECVVVFASDHIHLVRYTLDYGDRSSSLRARIVESLKTEDGALALFPTPRDFSVSLFYLSRRKNTFAHYIREYEFSAIDTTFPTISTERLVLTRTSFTLEKPISVAAYSPVAEFPSIAHSQNQTITSYSNGAIVTYDNESLLKLSEFHGAVTMVYRVMNQIFDVSSDILWRIERLSPGEPAVFMMTGYKLSRHPDSSTATIASVYLPLLLEPVGVALGPGKTLLCLFSTGRIEKYVWIVEKKRLIQYKILNLHREFPPRVPLAQHDVGFFVIQDPEDFQLLRVDVYLADTTPIRIVNPFPFPEIRTLHWGIVFLRDGRHLVIGHEQHVLLLQGVAPGLRWEQARIVATIDISNLGSQDSFSALSLTSNDLEVAFVSGGIWYKISIQTDEIASPLLIKRDPILLWRHKFSHKLSPEGIAFDHSRKQLIVSYSYGIGVYQLSHFTPSKLATTFSKSPRFGASLIISSPATWRLEYLENTIYLVPYLRDEDKFIPFWREHIELPPNEVAYTGLVMSPTGILFVVDFCGGILEVDVRGTFPMPKPITKANENWGSRGIVYLNDRFLLVGNSHTGVLTRVDVKSGARHRISVVPAPLPAASVYEYPYLHPLGLALLPDGRLSVLQAGRLFLLQDADGAWSSAHVVGSLFIAEPNPEQAFFLSIADPTEGTIAVLSKCREKNLYQFDTIAVPRQVELQSPSSFD